jgi:hypothetical protein
MDNLYNRIKQAHETFFGMKFTSIREMLLYRNRFLANQRQLKLNWAEIAEEFRIGELYAHELFRKLEYEHLDKVTKEERDLMETTLV